MFGDVNTFKWTATNTGRSAVRLTNTLRIAWETANLSVEDVIYIYPVDMTDDEIRYDIVHNDGAGAIISHSNPGLTTFDFENGPTRTGFEFELEDVIERVYLSSSTEITRSEQALPRQVIPMNLK